jgi:uncharacterized RDD family membrane protein YckC
MRNNMDEQVFAGFFVRLAAYLVDWVIVGTALWVVRIPVWIASLGGSDFLVKDFIFQYSVSDIVLYLLKIAYFILLTYYTGSTLGKKLFHIQVISAENRKPTFFEIVFRESVGKFLSALIIYVGYIMIGADKQKRGLHDMLSDTYVVYQHQKSVAVPAPVTYQSVPYTVQMPPYQAGAAGQNSYVPPVRQNEAPMQKQQENVSPMNQGGMTLQGQQPYAPPVNPSGTESVGQQPYVPTANQSGTSLSGEIVAEENKDSNENE